MMGAGGSPFHITFGVNLAGAEFGAVPGTIDVDYTYPTQAEFQYYGSKGCKLVRIPFKWERLQPVLYAALDATNVGRLTQCLMNLAGNALKFTDRGEVIMQVECVSRSSTNAQIRVSVIDSGIGIAREKLSLLFEKFTQVDASATRRYQGTGLGLAISKQLVELMGGIIGVQSTPGEGSLFWFELPLPLDETGCRPLPAANLRGRHQKNKHRAMESNRCRSTW